MEMLRNNYLSAGQQGYFPPPVGAKPKALAPVANRNEHSVFDDSSRYRKNDNHGERL